MYTHADTHTQTRTQHTYTHMHVHTHTDTHFSVMSVRVCVWVGIRGVSSNSTSAAAFFVLSNDTPGSVRPKSVMTRHPPKRASPRLEVRHAHTPPLRRRLRAGTPHNARSVHG